MEIPVRIMDSLYTISVSHKVATWLNYSRRAGSKSDTTPKCLLPLPTAGSLRAPVSGKRSLSPSRPHSLRSVNTRAAKAAPGLEVTVAAGAVRAHEGAVLAVSAVTTLSLAPWHQERIHERKCEPKGHEAYRAHPA